MTTRTPSPLLRILLAAMALTIAACSVAWARPDQQMLDEFRNAHPELFDSKGGWKSGAQPAAIPDIYGPGAVLNVGEVFMKVSNYGTIGNPFTNISSDPSMQWPGASQVEYLSFSLISVGAVNPTATDPNAVRRVSYFSEWRPPTLDPVDRMYKAYDGIVNGQRLVNDDGDVDPLTGKALVDEDFLDGHDNDGDKKIDEDFAAIGQQMYSCVMRDDTPAAVNQVANEKHIPIGLELRQLAWAYSVDGYQDFNPIEFTIYNRSGHMLDSMYFALRTDMDSGPIQSSTYYSDDFDLPFYPSGDFMLPVSPIDPQLQLHLDPSTGKIDSLCTKVPIKISGMSIVDDDGDEGKTPGMGSVLLLGCTTDPLGILAPRRCQFRAVRSYIGGTPYTSGGHGTIDQQKYEFMSSTENVDQETGAVTLGQGEQAGDYQFWWSVGPFNQVPDGGSFQVTVAFTVQKGDNQTILNNFKNDYQRFQAGTMRGEDLFSKYPVLANAYAAQVAYTGVYETPRAGFEDQVPDCHGCETGLKLPKGTPQVQKCAQCGDENTICKTVTEFATTWFNFDCDYCTGVWDEATNQGYYLRRWNAESPPPNPNLNVATSYNYSDNPDRNPTLTPSGDNQITLAWDNLSETTADPKTQKFDFRTYRLWKAANWTRPVGSSGPTDDDWALLGEYRLFDYAPNNKYLKFNPANPAVPDTVCPTLWIPQKAESMQVCLQFGDLWDRQSGNVIHPDPNVDCVRKDGQCVQDSGFALGNSNTIVKRTRYPIGRYRYVDHEVKNGFLYFYAVTAGDSSTGKEFFGRVAGVEAEGVTPQASTKSGKSVWVVPNPYRGYADISKRPSTWDLTPNASDPTGTHVDFMGLPSGKWSVRIYTVAGDLVAELHSDDPVNADIRSPVTGSDGTVRQGFNRQQDGPNDGQARWNLISRNGQDVVSGIYVFVVDSSQGQQRGRFVIIR